MPFVGVNFSNVSEADVERQGAGAGGWEPLEPGAYVLMAVDSTLKNAASGNGKVLLYTFRVVDGPCKGREFFDSLNIENKSAKAVEIAMVKYRMLAEAVGHPDAKRGIRNSEEIQNIPFTAQVVVKATQQGKRMSEIKSAEPLMVNVPVADPGVELADDEQIF